MRTGKKLGEAIAAAIQKKIDSGGARSKAEIARHFGVKPPSISDWERRGTISKHRLPELWSYFSDVVGPEHWGITDREMAMTPDMGNAHGQVATWETPDDLPPSDDRVWVDRWDFAFSAGNGGIQWEVRQKDALPFNLGFFKTIGCSPKDCRLLLVKGDSMEPFVFDRDMIMIDVTKTEIRDGRIYAVHFEGEPLIKQVFKQAGGALTLHSYNRNYPDRLIPLEDMKSLAIAGEVVYRSGSGFI